MSSTKSVRGIMVFGHCHGTVAPWTFKDKKFVSLKVSTDPSFIWSTYSKTVLQYTREYGKMNTGFSFAENPPNSVNQQMRNQD